MNLTIELNQHPEHLEAMILNQKHKWVVIDEIQKIPILLNEVHRLIEKHSLRFLLTGSSSRRLTKRNINLLGGRAWKAMFFPLTTKEIDHFNLDHYLLYGGLPHVYASKYPREELHAYINTYLNNEIRLEGYVRNLPPFTRFLKQAALCSGELINYANIASDAQLPSSTVREYFHVLEDTLIGFALAPWTKSKKRKAIQTAKFYMFDLGVMHALLQTTVLDRNSNLYGKSFELFIISQVRAYVSYVRSFEELYFWRSKSSYEVDLIISDHTAIEIKATQKIGLKHLKSLKALKEESIFKRYILVSQDPIEKRFDDIECMHYQTFLDKLWTHQIQP